MAKLFLILGLLLAISTTSIKSFAQPIASNQTSGSPQPETFYSIYIGGAPDFKTNVTKNVLNGSASQMDQQLQSLIADEYKEINKSKSQGPVIFLGKTPAETIVKDKVPQSEFLKYYRDLMKNEPSTERRHGGAHCWLWLVGGGSMHGDCPKPHMD